MKILLFITGYSQLQEYDYFSRFLKRAKTLNSVCDVYIYCNNPNITEPIVTYYHQFDQKNKYLYITSLNGGYRVGPVEAISNSIDAGVFSTYDYVIHLHPDVFITDDSYIMDVLIENLHNDIVFFITKSNGHDAKFFSFDFFIFKPKLLTTNIFQKHMYTFTECVEHYLCNMIHMYDIKYTFIKRFNNDNWHPRRIDDNLKLYHEHDLDKVRIMLELDHIGNV